MNIHPIRKEYCIYVEKNEIYKQWVHDFSQIKSYLGRLMIALRVLQGESCGLMKAIHGVYRDFKDVLHSIERNGVVQEVLKEIELLPCLEDRHILTAWILMECRSMENEKQALVIMNNLIEKISKDSNRNTMFEYFTRGRIQTDSDLIIQDYTLAIKSNDQFPLPLNNRAIAWTNTNQFDLALKDYTSSIELDPDYVLTYQNRASLFNNQLLQFDRAIEDLNAAIKLEVDVLTSLNLRFKLFRKRSMYMNALEDINRICQLAPNAFENYLIRADLKYYAFHLPEEALEDCNRALRLNPTSLIALYNRGVLHGELGRHNESLKDYTTAIEYGMKNSSKQSEYSFMMATLYLCRSITLRAQFSDFVGSLNDANMALQYANNNRLKENYLEALQQVFQYNLIGNA